MKLAVVGATGLVGKTILDVLAKRNFSYDELLLVASERSVGKKINYNGKDHTVISMEDAISKKPHIAIFSAGGDTSKIWAPEFAKVGTTVIDNSSAWRMDKSKKLVVPEINAKELTKNDKIIANPNCSTIQLVMVLSPLHKAFKIKRVIVSTYQSITGSGVKATRQLDQEEKGENAEKVYPYQIYRNAIPQCDVFEENDYTKEEMKLTRETKKIIGDENILVSATAVRIPVTGGHSESVNIEFENSYDIKEVKEILSKQSGIILKDEPQKNDYPMPFYSQNKDEVFVGRIRADHSHPKAVNMWIVADNLRKGAATNAVQIAEFVLQNNLV